MSPEAVVALKLPLYALAFFLFGWKVAKRPVGPNIGWSALGGIARWLGGMVLGGVLMILLARFWLPGALVMAALLGLRLTLWFVLARFLHETRPKPTFVFALIMTLLNVAFDIAVFGLPTSSDLTEPWGMGN